MWNKVCSSTLLFFVELCLIDGHTIKMSFANKNIINSNWNYYLSSNYNYSHLRSVHLKYHSGDEHLSALSKWECLRSIWERSPCAGSHSMYRDSYVICTLKSNNFNAILKKPIFEPSSLNWSFPHPNLTHSVLFCWDYLSQGDLRLLSFKCLHMYTCIVCFKIFNEYWTIPSMCIVSELQKKK